MKRHYNTSLREIQSNIPNSVSNEVFYGCCHADNEGRRIASQTAGVRNQEPWKYAREAVTEPVSEVSKTRNKEGKKTQTLRKKGERQGTNLLTKIRVVRKMASVRYFFRKHSEKLKQDDITIIMSLKILKCEH